MTPLAQQPSNFPPRDEIWRYEEQILNFLNRVGELAHRTPAMSTVRALFYLYDHLTQFQVRLLAKKYLEKKNLRGYSAGSISNILLFLETQKFLTKALPKGSNEYIYTITTPVEKTISQSFPMLQLLLQVLEEILNRVMKLLEQTSVANLSGFSQLSNFATQFQKILPIYKEIVTTTQKSVEISSTPVKIISSQLGDLFKRISPNPPPNLPPKYQYLAFHPPLDILEQEIHALFNLRMTISGAEPDITNRVMLYFYTRQDLTQGEIKALTSLSIGAVSQAVQTLLHNQFIEKVTQSGGRARNYHVCVLVRTLFHYLFRYELVFGEGAKNLRAILADIDSYRLNHPEDQELNRIFNATNVLLRLTSVFEYLNVNLAKILENNEKSN